jgi:hypothetical protein
MNATRSAPANDSNRHKRDRVFRRQKCHQHFGFDLETLRLERQSGPSRQMDEPETALCVGQMPARAPRQLAAHPAVHLPAQPQNGARVVHAVADNEQRPGLFSALQKGGQIVRRMLAVAIESEGPFKALTQRPGQAGPERRALAEVPLMASHRRARRRSQGRGVVRRTVIHDQHRGKTPADCDDQGCDTRRLVETRDHHRACRRSKHASSLIQVPRRIEARMAGAGRFALSGELSRCFSAVRPLSLVTLEPCNLTSKRGP